MDISRQISSLQQQYYSFSPMLNNMVISVLLLLSGFILGKILGKLVSWILKQVNADQYAKKIFGASFSFSSFMSTIVSGAIYIFTLYYTIRRLSLTTIILVILAILIGLLLIVTFIGLVSDILPNAIARISVRSSKKMRIGNPIKIDRVSGKITNIGFTFTTLITPEREKITIPHILMKKRLRKE